MQRLRSSAATMALGISAQASTNHWASMQGAPTFDALRKKIFQGELQALQKRQNVVLTCLYKQALQLLLAWSDYCWLSSITWSKASAAITSAVSRAIQYTCSCQSSVITFCKLCFSTFFPCCWVLLKALKWSKVETKTYTRIAILLYWALNISQGMTETMDFEKKISPYRYLNKYSSSTDSLWILPSEVKAWLSTAI